MKDIDDKSFPQPGLLSISFVQGLVLLFLHLSTQQHFWPDNEPQWLVSFYTIAIISPLLLLLSLNAEDYHKNFISVGCFSIFLGLIAYYIGLQATPYEIINPSSLFFSYGITIIIAAFIFLIYLQQYISLTEFSYQKLFRYSWRNFLTSALAALFTLILWGILMLWAKLFEVIKIVVFADLFEQEWFYYPVLTVAFGFAIIILRKQTKIVDVITKIQQPLMKYLLLILIFITIIFICSLPFTGLDSLWETGSGSTIILWLQALILFFVNAVYQDDSNERPYSLTLHRYIYCGVALLPIYSAISLYGLSMRIDQYGWTISRSWGILVWLIFALFSLGYLFAIIKKRDNWIEILSWVNIRMGLVVLLSMLLINSPIIDFRKISVSSQMDRLASGKSTYDELDIFYFKSQLAAPGYRALQSLKEQIKDSHPDIASKIENNYTRFTTDVKIPSKTDFENSLIILPADETINDDLMTVLYEHYENDAWSQRNNTTNFLLSVDLNEDGNKDYLFLSIFQNINQGQFFSYSDNKWQSYEIYNDRAWLPTDTISALKEGRYEIMQQKWKNIKVADKLITIMPNPSQ